MKKILTTIIIIVLLIISVLLYSHYIATQGLRVKEYKVESNKIDENFHGLKIVHISDLHYGRTFKEKNLNLLVKKINLIKPDIVVLTGDLLDKDIKLNNEEQEILTKGLKEIKVKLNKYAITGNHDYKFDYWESLITEGDFINLNDEFDLIYNEGYNPIIINGISTNLHGDKSIEEKLANINSFLDTEENVELANNFKILIIHEPDYIKKFNYQEYDLILAGHSHGGQVRLPFVGAFILPPGAKNYYDEFYQLDNSLLYISSGLGTSNMDFRLFNRPSINFYRLTNN